MVRKFLIVLLALLSLSCSKLSRKSYVKVPAAQSGIHFLNELIENDTLNYTIFPYMYMGGGVSVGDINNDGLDDIFFSGNLVPNKLYLNKGGFQFEDISAAAGIEGDHQWFAGSTMADVNDDGWLDIYVCASAKYPPGGNVLYVNNGDNTFTERAAEYGIDDQSSSVQASFFDYNNDGLLDLFVANYPIVLVTMGATYYYNKMQENSYEESGHLYENRGDGTFVCVTDKAGLRNFGMSIGIVAMDFNNDGWKDLYISNDFNVPDYFYLNNGDGTFTNRVRESTFQTSIFGMGFDAADMNNDGLIDLFQIDMTPEDHVRAMVNVAPMSQKTFDLSLEYGFHYQYMHNALQLNNGIYQGLPVFSNISLFAGVGYTDWSWGGVFMDMDLDGQKDLYVTNGVLKDINNLDVLEVSSNRIYFHEHTEYSPELYPSTPLKNFAYRNTGDLRFVNMADDWGFDEENLSNGMAYGDFDNDGDLDIVISNVNTLSEVYENRLGNGDSNFLKVKLKGPEGNHFGLGSILQIRTGDVTQVQELTLTRGYQSSQPPYFHFGTGDYSLIDEIVLTWPDGRQEKRTAVAAGIELVMDYENSTGADVPAGGDSRLFMACQTEAAPRFLHREDMYQDFELEPLLPHLNSREGPGLSTGDVNGDGLEDVFIGNGRGFQARLLLQRPQGGFKEAAGPWMNDSLYEDCGALIFDADDDGLNDLYLVSGGNDPGRPPEFYRDRLYLNTGEGFISIPEALPAASARSGKCVESCDFDGDGDLDLFVGGRIVPGKYPMPAGSRLLLNNGKPGTALRFEDHTAGIAADLLECGLVTDACWLDIDEDGDQDLVVVGEWMNISFFENNDGRFSDVTEELGFAQSRGWWNSISPVDVDGDGDLDLIAGNLGLNYRYKATDESPFEIYLNDFNLDGKQDIVLAYWQNGRHLPLKGLNASSKQIPVLKMRFEGHEHYASSSLEEIYGEQMLAASLHYRINTFASSWIENQGRGSFLMHELPGMAQLSAINQVLSLPSGYIIAAGNKYYSEAETPRSDAGVGLVLSWENGVLRALPPDRSGLMIPGQVNDASLIQLAGGEPACIFAINNDSLRTVVAAPVQ